MLAALAMSVTAHAQEREAGADSVRTGWLFAVKTNLLYDICTAVNIEVEVPISKRFSIEGGIIFPDWVDRTTNRFCLQSCIGSVEFKTWLGDRNRHRLLEGHFLSLYGQYGDFDFQPFTQQGLRCYRLWSAGAGYGYAHCINRARTLSLEYSIAVGYCSANYCKYERSEDGKELLTYPGWSGSFCCVLPTKLQVSLVWLIPYKNKVER